MQHIEITINTGDAILKDVLVGELSEIGFDGFEEVEDGLKAFATESSFDEIELQLITNRHGVAYTKAAIPEQNWNALWESNFEPITVDDFVGVRAGFHDTIPGVEHEIVITPKMSFGTGHHATTFMMMQLMHGIDFKNQSVFDFGSGTGILAILAEKLGANNILAVDYDDWCIENATENVLANNCSAITILKADNANLGRAFDIVLANINKNIILDNMEALAKSAVRNGKILLSGLLETDEADILAAAALQGWSHLQTVKKNNWIAMQFTAKS
ncbi:50S ribosomal protein L11 methyltransferase [Parasediminibacterium sp. JCM 36343]|uniref:50S ribosomal protein L11 methyltransferase n=1 Tax=Parasediminibacterium sp. JCM 36343 TaxID=3374279 RepID=UPI00397DBCD2